MNRVLLIGLLSFLFFPGCFDREDESESGETEEKPPPPPRPARVYGKVVDVGGRPLSGVDVSIKGLANRDQTNASGEYYLEYVPGRFEIEFKKSGYLADPLTLDLTQSLPVDVEVVEMLPLPAQSGVYALVESGLQRVAHQKLTVAGNMMQTLVGLPNSRTTLPMGTTKFLVQLPPRERYHGSGEVFLVELQFVRRAAPRNIFAQHAKGLRGWVPRRRINTSQRVLREGRAPLVLFEAASLPPGRYAFHSGVLDVDSSIDLATYSGLHRGGFAFEISPPTRAVTDASAPAPEIPGLTDRTAELLQEVTASSSLRNSPPEKAVDNNPRTAWNEGAKNDGSGEWIQLSFKRSASVKRLVISPGYDKMHPRSGDLFLANNRPASITVSTSDGQSVPIKLPDSRDPFPIALAGTPIQWVKVTVDSVYEGSRWSDMCISEVRVLE